MSKLQLPLTLRNPILLCRDCSAHAPINKIHATSKIKPFIAVLGYMLIWVSSVATHLMLLHEFLLDYYKLHRIGREKSLEISYNGVLIGDLFFISRCASMSVV